MQADVGVDHADERHVGEVQPLGDHLRAEQDVDLARRGRRRAPAAWLPGLRIVSLSMRRTTWPGNFSSISACSFSVPSP